MAKDLFSIVLIHLFNKERKTFHVELVTNTYVAIRWGQSGVYDLNLAKNVLTARSQKAQRKGKALWQAEDIHAVRKLVADYMKGRDPIDESRKAAEAHIARMPKFDGGAVISNDLDELE